MMMLKILIMTMPIIECKACAIVDEYHGGLKREYIYCHNDHEYKKLGECQTCLADRDIHKGNWIRQGDICNGILQPMFKKK